FPGAMGKHVHPDKHPDHAVSSRRVQAVRRLRRIHRARRERHTRRLAAASLVTAITTGAVLAAVTGHVAEARADRAPEPFDLTQVSWPADTALEETAVQRSTAQAAMEIGEAAE